MLLNRKALYVCVCVLTTNVNNKLKNKTLNYLYCFVSK